MTKSKLYRAEAVPNSQRKTNGAKVYYPVLVCGAGMEPALFSDSQILVAIQRAKQQPEDVPEFYLGAKLPKWKFFVARLLGIPVV